MRHQRAARALRKNHAGKGVVNSKLLSVTCLLNQPIKTVVVTISLLPLVPRHYRSAPLTETKPASKLKVGVTPSPPLHPTMEDNYADPLFTDEQRSLAWSPQPPFESNGAGDCRVGGNCGLDFNRETARARWAQARHRWNREQKRLHEP
jgi:hypothetical protein